MNVKIGSILVGSQNAEELRAWYADAFGVTPDDVGRLTFGSVDLLIAPHSDVKEKALEPARAIVNFHVPDARATGAALKAKGVRFTREVTEESFGIVGTIEDPDGNLVQIIQLTAGH